MLALAIVLLTGFLVYRSGEPPSALGPDAPYDQFSAARAMRDVEEIAKRPHPLASSDNARVRQYLLDRLDELDADPEEQTVTTMTCRWDPCLIATAHNIVAHLEGSASSGQVVLVGHYDSVPTAPGAGDDASAVAAILESVRALGVGERELRNDVLILFTDGEEIGLAGSRGFVENYSRLSEIKAVLNFEMRGDYGPSLMFQTSDPNSWLIKQFARAARYPRATSLSSAIYKRLPNDTDLTEFMKAGLAGMNFAAAGGIQRYHTMLDNPKMLDQRSLQHQGEYALAMTRRLANLPLNRVHSKNQIYFSIGNRLFRYGERAAIPLAILFAVLTGGLIGFGIRTSRMRAAGVVTGFATFVATLAIAGAEGWAMSHLMAVVAEGRILPSHTTYGAAWFAAAAVAVVVASVWAFYEWLGRYARQLDLGAGALAAWALLTLASAIALPGGSYMLSWPLLFAVIASGILLSGLASFATPIAPVCALLAIVPGLMTMTGLITAGAEATPMFLVMSSIGAALLVGLAIPYLDVFTGGRRRYVPIASVALATIFLAIGASKSGFDATHPRPDSIFYVLDAENGLARWVSIDDRPDRYTAQFFRNHVRKGSLAAISGSSVPFAGHERDWTIEGDAPAVKLTPPQLKVSSDTTNDEIRTVKMHVDSPRHAPIVWMTVPDSVKVIDAIVGGKSVGGVPRNGWAAWYWGVPDEGFDFELKVKAGGELGVTLVDQSDGLPDTGEKIAPRPPDTMPRPFLMFDSCTLVRNTFMLGSTNLTRR